MKKIKYFLKKLTVKDKVELTFGLGIIFVVNGLSNNLDRVYESMETQNEAILSLNQSYADSNKKFDTMIYYISEQNDYIVFLEDTLIENDMEIEYEFSANYGDFFNEYVENFEEEIQLDEENQLDDETLDEYNENILEEEENEIIDIYSIYSTYEVELLARLVWNEARGIESYAEKASVIWVVLNRMDNTSNDFKNYNTIEKVLFQPSQFSGFGTHIVVEEQFVQLAEEVLYAYECEKQFGDSSGRILPQEYLWFSGDGKHNYLRTTFPITGIYFQFN